MWVVDKDEDKDPSGCEICSKELRGITALMKVGTGIEYDRESETETTSSTIIVIPHLLERWHQC
jgi:hypothetical protein